MISMNRLVHENMVYQSRPSRRFLHLDQKCGKHCSLSDPSLPLNNILLLENQTEHNQNQNETEHEGPREPQTDLVLLLTARVVKLLGWDIRALSRS